MRAWGCFSLYLKKLPEVGKVPIVTLEEGDMIVSESEIILMKE